MAHITHIDISVKEEDYYPYYMEWIKFFILPTEHLVGVAPFTTRLHIHCKYKNGNLDSGRHVSPIYRTITSVQNDHPEITSGYSIISFK